MNSFPSRIHRLSVLFAIVHRGRLCLCRAPRRPRPQDIPIGVTYICNGEHIYIENCNIRDTSDTSNCMVAHPDHLTPTGINSYTYVSRGALKKLLPTCQQPSAKQARRSQGLPAKATGHLQRQRPEGRTADEGASAAGEPARQRSPGRSAEKR